MVKTIIKAAVKYVDKIYTGFDHGECFKKLNEDNMIIVHNRIEQGFVDNDGVFVDRKQAMVISKEAGQLSYETNKKTLISEDLHLNWLNNQSRTIDDMRKALEMVCAELRGSYCRECMNNGLLECDGKDKCWLTKKIQPNTYLEKVKEMKNGKNDN